MFYDKILEIKDYELLSRSELARTEHEAGRELLSTLLKDHLGIEDYKVAIGEHEKPYLDSLPYHFSISHSRGLVACAISSEQIGIDIERLVHIERDKARALSERFFTPEESAELRAQNYSSQAFFTIWTRKEALSKCFGTPFMENASQNSLACDEIISTVGKNYIYSVMIKK